MKPIELVKALEKCSLLRDYQRDDPIKRYWWAVNGYIDGYISKAYMDREIARFMKLAEKLVAHNETLAVWKWLDEQAKTPRVLTDAERMRQQKWLEQEALRATRMELQRQRKRLREGHETLKAIRRLLTHGARSSLVLASGPGTSSPT